MRGRGICLRRHDLRSRAGLDVGVDRVEERLDLTVAVAAAAAATAAALGEGADSRVVLVCGRGVLLADRGLVVDARGLRRLHCRYARAAVRCEHRLPGRACPTRLAGAGPLEQESAKEEVGNGCQCGDAVGIEAGRTPIGDVVCEGVGCDRGSELRLAHSSRRRTVYTVYIQYIQYPAGRLGAAEGMTVGFGNDPVPPCPAVRARALVKLGRCAVLCVGVELRACCARAAPIGA